MGLRNFPWALMPASATAQPAKQKQYREQSPAEGLEKLPELHQPVRFNREVLLTELKRGGVGDESAHQQTETSHDHAANPAHYGSDAVECTSQKDAAAAMQNNRDNSRENNANQYVTDIEDQYFHVAPYFEHVQIRVYAEFYLRHDIFERVQENLGAVSFV